MKLPTGGRVSDAGCYPGIGSRIVSAACVQALAIISAPDDHFVASPHRRVTISCRGRIGSAGGGPTIGAGIVSPAGVEGAATVAAPDDHFTASPDCCMGASRSRCVGDAGGCPRIIGAAERDRDFWERVGGVVHIYACVILSEVEGSRGITHQTCRGVPRLRSE